MRLVVGSVALVLSVAVLLPAAGVPAALAQDESASPPASVVPSASVEPSASATLDVVVELLVEPGDPALEWAITVTGGSPSVDILELREIEIGSHGAFTIAMDGPSATVEMTPALPPRWELIIVGCRDDLDPPTEIEPIVEPGGFVLQVVTPAATTFASRRASCWRLRIRRTGRTRRSRRRIPWLASSPSRHREGYRSSWP